MLGYGPAIGGEMLGTFELCGVRFQELMDLRGSAARYYTSRTPDELEDELYSSDDDDELDDDMDWTTDELGLDPFEDKEI